jgi:hypothetical protein
VAGCFEADAIDGAIDFRPPKDVDRPTVPERETRPGAPNLRVVSSSAPG